jgi:hypothetical protein
VIDVNDPQERRPVSRKTEEALDQRGLYGPGFLDEITVPQDEARQAREVADQQDVADHPLDPQLYRDGGPQETPGMATTTGGTAGPASVHPYHDRRPEGPGKIAPTTTGDATSGGMGTPVGGSTSDATTGGTTGGTIVGGSDTDPNRAYSPEEGAGADRTGGGEYGG